MAKLWQEKQCTGCRLAGDQESDQESNQENNLNKTLQKMADIRHSKTKNGGHTT